MIIFSGRMLLLDIEGTVSPLAFVHEVMFPYARKHVAAYLKGHAQDVAVQAALKQMARDAEADPVGAWEPGDETDAVFIEAEVHRLMDADVKATGLKLLQGLIWEAGFQLGELRSTLFEDVLPALDAWHAAGKKIRIYSSVSIHAQKLFFAHTAEGDVRDRLSGYYDTSTGGKKEPQSYRTIAADAEVQPSDVLFLSDVVDELDAARTAGMTTALVLRAGNKAQPSSAHPVIDSFAEITLPAT